MENNETFLSNLSDALIDFTHDCLKHISDNEEDYNFFIKELSKSLVKFNTTQCLPKVMDLMCKLSEKNYKKNHEEKKNDIKKRTTEKNLHPIT